MGPGQSVLSIDLAHKSYADIGVCSLRVIEGRIEIAPIRLPSLGLAGLLHSRICERQLATQGKTGLQGVTKPANYAPFIAFAIELFDRLAGLGWPRLPDASALASSSRFAIESFPTSAWRSLGLKPLPGKANTPAGMVQEKLAELGCLVPIDVELDDSWREGFIVNPSRSAVVQSGSGS